MPTVVRLPDDDLIARDEHAALFAAIVDVAGSKKPRRSGLGSELGDLVSQTGHLAACSIGMHDAFLRRAHDHWLCFFQRRKRRAAIASRDRFLDLAHDAAHLRLARPVDLRASRDLTDCLAGRRGIGHGYARWRAAARPAHPLAARHPQKQAAASISPPIRRLYSPPRRASTAVRIERKTINHLVRRLSCRWIGREKPVHLTWAAAARLGGLDPCPGRIAVDMGVERLDARHQRLAIEQFADANRSVEGLAIAAPPGPRA